MARRPVAGLSRAKRATLIATAVGALATPVVVGLAETAAMANLKFDVVSIKLSVEQGRRGHMGYEIHPGGRAAFRVCRCR
jgi:hypothetical protein